MQELKCPECGYLNPDIRELGYKLPWTCGKCPHIWRLQDVMPQQAIEATMRERATLIGWKHSHGLNADEAARLEWLNAEAQRLCPLVTPEMTEVVEAIRARSNARQARSKTPNDVAKRPAASGSV